MKQIKGYSRSFVIIWVVIAFLSSCTPENNSEIVTIDVSNIGFECHLPRLNGDTCSITPIIMYLNTEVVNTTEKHLLLGAYNHRFDQNNKKYGRFELVHLDDTLCLYSNYPYQYEFQPGQSIGMQLYYEGSELFGFDKLLHTMSLAWVGDEPDSEKLCADKVEGIQGFVENLKINYIPSDSTVNENLKFITRFFPNVSVDYRYNDLELIRMQKIDSGWKISYSEPLSVPANAADSSTFDSADSSSQWVRSRWYDVDTLIGRTRMKFYICEKSRISPDSVFDRSLFLSYSRDGRELIGEREIQKYDFDSIVPLEQLRGAHIWSCHIEYFDPDKAVLSLNICAPDSDDCCGILLTIDSLGGLSAERETIEWDEGE